MTKTLTFSQCVIMDGIILKKYILLLFAGDTVEAPQGALVPELHFDTTGLEIIWFKCLPGKLSDCLCFCVLQFQQLL